LVLSCLNATNGAVVWSKDLMALYGSTMISWQNAASPVVENGLVIVNANVPNKSLLALRAADGSLAWQTSASDKMTQATPVPVTLLGARQVIFYAQSGLVAVNPTNGAVLWRYACTYNGTSIAASPVVAGDLVYCSAAYNTGARAVRVSRTGGAFRTNQVWRLSGALQNHWATPVYCQGYLYGLYGYGNTSDAPLECVDPATGTELWSVAGFGFGGVVVVGKVILVLTAGGDLVVIEPDPGSYREIARYHALSGPCWNVPAVSNGRVYARSTTQTVALDVSLPPPPALRFLNSGLVREGGLRLQLGNADGTGVDAARLDRIQVLASPTPASALTNWTLLTEPLQWDDGMVWVELPTGTGPAQEFYRTREQP
jgi:outer membrane protein assembly factor BamB